MGVTGKLEVIVKIKHSGDVLHQLFGTNPHHVSTIVPDTVHGCDVHDGEFGQPGSILQWDYTIDGEKCIAKSLVEAIDEEKQSVRFKFLEGSSELKYYKNMTVALHVVTKGGIDAVKWDIEFERCDDVGFYPANLMNFIIKMTRDIEAHHINNA